MVIEASDRPILIFGINGQVGHALASVLSASGRVVGLTRAEADLSKPESLRAIVRRIRPSVVLNAAAYTAVDRAEREPELVQTINAIAPGVLAEEAEAIGACIVHYSSDYVFDGRKATPYSEGDTPNPLSVYGHSKLAGERAIAVVGGRHVVLRTSWVVGAHGSNFVKTILKLAAERASLNVIADQHGTPTSARLIADVTAQAVGAMLGRPSASLDWGLYHLTARGSTTWHGLARHAVRRARELGMELRARPEDVAEITTAEYPTAAVRPANSRLDTTRICSELSLALPDWREGIDGVIEEISDSARGPRPADAEGPS